MFTLHPIVPTILLLAVTTCLCESNPVAAAVPTEETNGGYTYHSPWARSYSQRYDPNSWNPKWANYAGAGCAGYNGYNNRGWNNNNGWNNGWAGADAGLNTNGWNNGHNGWNKNGYNGQWANNNGQWNNGYKW